MMPAPNDLALIEQVKCPVCKTRPRRHCHRLSNGRDEWITRIFPWRRDSAGPEWVHAPRRDLAIANGLLKP